MGSRVLGEGEVGPGLASDGVERNDAESVEKHSSGTGLRGAPRADGETFDPALALVRAPRLRPSDSVERTFPLQDPEALAERLPPARRAAWRAFREAFPDTDLTDVPARHQALLDRRAQFGAELTDEEREAHAAWVADIEALGRELVALRAGGFNLALGGREDDGRGFYLEGFQRGRPRYTWTLNAAAAISTAVHLVRRNAAFDPAVGDTVSGDGLYVNVNDHGEIYSENPEFQLPDNGGTRIVYKEIPSYADGNRAHMTHVAGTVGAWGYNASVMGMAPRVWLRAHIQQYTSDITGYGMATPGQLHSTTNPRTGEREMKSVIGNTSLGNPDTNTVKGVYTSVSASFDSTLRDYPYYTHFYAAGNNGTSSEDTAYYTLHTDTQVAKNIITIGGVNDATRDAAGNLTGGAALYAPSSRGPTHDGRIKPDFVANGVGLTSPNSATGVGALSGTSMASPNASGSATVLVDYLRRRLPGHYVRSSTIRALLANTADERGLPGPDYTYGWGLVNVHRAAGVVKRHAENPAQRVLVEDLLSSDETRSAVYRYDGAGPIRVTVAWLDPPGGGQTPENATRAPRLINDLNLRLIGPGGTVHYPYVMPFVTGNATLEPFDHALRNVAAVTGINTTDNVEQVFINVPAAGDYMVEVSHAGTLSGGSQRFSLVVGGMGRPDPLATAIASVSPEVGNGTDNFALTVNGSGFVLGSDVILRRAGSPDAAAYAQVVTDDQIVCRVDTAAMAKGYWDVIVRAPDGTEIVAPNAFLVPASGGRVTLYANDFESGASGLTLDSGWAVADPDKGEVNGPADAQQGDFALVTYPGGNYPGNVDTAVVLPPFSTVGYSSIQVEIQRWIGVRRQGNSRDYGYVEYSLNGTSWTVVTEHNNLIESNWAARTYSLPSAAAGNATVYVRFRLKTDANNHSFGWNIDDVRITGLTALPYPPVFQSTPITAVTALTPYAYVAVATDSDTPGSSLSFSAAGLPPGLSLTDNGDGTATLAGAASAGGSFPIQLTVTDGVYETHQLFTLNIQRQTATVHLSELTPVYNGTARAPTVTTDPGGLSFAVAYDDAPVAAGAYAVRVWITDPAYEGESAAVLTIAPAPLALAADALGKTVDAPDPALTWSILGGTLFGDDAVAGAPVRDPGETSGIYAIRRGTLDAGPNYALEFTNGEFQILTAQGFLDANGNDIDDVWEERYFPDGDLPATIVKRGVEMTLLEVFTANLDPHDENSYFAITEMDADGKFRFTTATDRLYTVFWTDNLRDPNSWRALEGWTDVPGTGAPMEATAPDGPAVYIRVRVRLP